MTPADRCGSRSNYGRQGHLPARQHGPASSSNPKWDYNRLMLFLLIAKDEAEFNDVIRATFPDDHMKIGQ